MKRKVTGLKRKLLMPLIFSLAVAPSLNTGSTLKNNYHFEKIERYLEKREIEENLLKKDINFNPFSLEKEYLSKSELEFYIERHSRLIPEEFSKKDITKLAIIESSLNKNAYREDYRRRSSDGILEIDTIRQGGILQVTENTYNALEKKIPYYEGVFNVDKNLEVGLKNLKFIRDYNINFNPHWNESSLEEKQKYLIASHNWGIGRLQRNNWDLSKVPSITSNFFDKFYSME